MSNKISIYLIIKDHLGTLTNHSSGKLDLFDHFVQFIVPLLLCVIYYFYCPNFGSGVGSNIDQAIVAAFSIFTALLFNLQIMIMGLLDKPLELIVPESENEVLNHKKKERKQNFIRQIFYNISFAVLISISLVTISIVLVFFGGTEWVFTKVIEIFLVSHFLVVGLMILKRTHSLFSQM